MPGGPTSSPGLSIQILIKLIFRYTINGLTINHQEKRCTRANDTIEFEFGRPHKNTSKLLIRVILGLRSKRTIWVYEDSQALSQIMFSG